MRHIQQRDLQSIFIAFVIVSFWHVINDPLFDPLSERYWKFFWVEGVINWLTGLTKKWPKSFHWNHYYLGKNHLSHFSNILTFHYESDALLDCFSSSFNIWCNSAYFSVCRRQTDTLQRAGHSELTSSHGASTSPR